MNANRGINTCDFVQSMQQQEGNSCDRIANEIKLHLNIISPEIKNVQHQYITHVTLIHRTFATESKEIIDSAEASFFAFH